MLALARGNIVLGYMRHESKSYGLPASDLATVAIRARGEFPRAIAACAFAVATCAALTAFPFATLASFRLSTRDFAIFATVFGGIENEDLIATHAFAIDARRLRAAFVRNATAFATLLIGQASGIALPRVADATPALRRFGHFIGRLFAPTSACVAADAMRANRANGRSAVARIETARANAFELPVFADIQIGRKSIAFATASAKAIVATAISSASYLATSTRFFFAQYAFGLGGGRVGLRRIACFGALGAR